LYLKIAPNLKLNNTIRWNVTGTGSIQSFSYDDLFYFPSYVGAIPSVVDKNVGLISYKILQL
jgi:hypothetical protein